MIKIIILIIINVFLANINAKDYKNDTDFFIAKNLFQKQEYLKSEFILKNIILENENNNKYVIKAKILKALIEYKKNDKINAEYTIKDTGKINNNYNYYAKILYLKSIIYYNINNNYLKKFFKINNNKQDKTYEYKALLALKKIKTYKKYSNKIKNNIKIIKNDINKYKINICNYYIKKKAYLAVINRLEYKDSNLKLKDMEDYYKIYMILKSYNELLLDNISKKILNKIKKNVKIQESSNLLYQ